MKKILSIVLVLVLSFGCFSLVSFAEETDTVEHLTEVPEGYVGIYNKDDLDNIKLDMSGKYILMNDIVFEDSDYVKGGSFYNSGKGWEPIGTSSTSFKGTLDGNNYRIKNLYINNPKQDYIGLFGYVSGATITRVSLENANIIGKDCVGGIVGYSYSSTTISYCNVQGAISGTNSVGGMAGNCYPGTKNNYITFCSNTSLVSATSSYAGGIAGYIVGEGVGKCIEIENCYNTGDIFASSYAGGLVGKSYYYVTVYHCYSLGNVTAKSYYGGCFGDTWNASAFCYYLDEAVENPTCTAGIPKSEDQLKKASTFEQWDFKTIWTTAGREDYPYPEIIGSYPIFSEDVEHKHEYASKITTPATHIATGVMTFTCECGDTYTEAIAKTTEHSYTSEVTTQPTHLAEGVETYTCECGDTYTEVIAKIAEHSYVAVVTAPTCIAKGYTTYTCECGDTYDADYVDAKGHSFEAIVSAPTCTKYGYTTYVCLCGENYVGDYVSVKGHIDNNNDYKCDYNCGFEFEKIDTPTPDTPSDLTDNCACNCHDSGIAGLLFRLINFFQKLFGMNKVCACGAKH